MQPFDKKKTQRRRDHSQLALTIFVFCAVKPDKRFDQSERAIYKSAILKTKDRVASRLGMGL